MLRAYLFPALIVAAFSALIVMQAMRHDVLSRIEAKLDVSERSTDMGTIKSTWTSGSTDHEYSTTRMDGETAEEHAARHAAGLNAMQEQFPPGE